MKDYRELKEELTSLVKRSIRQKLFADEDHLIPSPTTINNILEKYNTDITSFKFFRDEKDYKLIISMQNLPWHSPTETMQIIHAISLENPALSLFLNIKSSLSEIAKTEIEKAAKLDSRGDFEKYFNEISYRIDFLKEEILKTIERIPQMKNEIVLHLFLLKKEKEYFSKWKELKKKRLGRIFELQCNLEEAWAEQVEAKVGDQVLIIDDLNRGPFLNKGLVWTDFTGTLFEPVSTITMLKPVDGKTGVLNQVNGSELFATSEDHKRKYPAYARTFFLSEEYAKDVLPVLTEEIKRSCHKD